MKYEGDIAAAQQRIANTSDLFRRRLAVLEEMAPHPGERVIEVGCGNGSIAAEDGKQWLEELEKSQARSIFFFSSTPLMSTAITV